MQFFYIIFAVLVKHNDVNTRHCHFILRLLVGLQPGHMVGVT